jgi:hypothetical protein
MADWLRAVHPGARIVSISRKDRSAITLAGRTKGDVFWVLPQAGRFVTSMFYGDALPGWLQQFNASRMAELWSDTIWRNEVPSGLISRARPDSALFEADHAHVTFPHVYGERHPTRSDAARNVWVTEQTPVPDAAVFALAEAALAELLLGADDITDYIALGLSQTDAIGHEYGPYSLEQLDNLLRLDRELGAFLSELDARVGAGRWVLGLSADHGVMTSPEVRVADGQPGHRLTVEDGRQLRHAVLEAQARSSTPEDVPQLVAQAVRQLPFVAAAYLTADYTRAEPADSFARLYRNSYVPGRIMGGFFQLGLDVRLTEGTIAEGRGSTHGSPYWYDRHVPLLFYGAGVRHGESRAAARTVDFAPTLFALAGVPVPDGLDGRSLAPVVTGAR